MGYHLFGNTEQSYIHHGRVSEHDKEVYGKIEEMEWLGSYETLEEAEKEQAKFEQKQDKLFNKGGRIRRKKNYPR